ncbi:MAG: endosialidase [Marvinbryantia sp.]|jgi:hypothetical protein
MTEMIIRREEDGTISFGNYELEQKTKVSDFENAGDIYKIKTFKEITKLEKNEMFVYESVPGTAVSHMKANADGMEFQVESSQDVQITVGLEEETVYRIFVDSEDVGTMKTNLSGKLSVNVELEPGKTVSVKIVK